jgi:hypothetical protein
MGCDYGIENNAKSRVPYDWVSVADNTFWTLGLLDPLKLKAPLTGIRKHSSAINRAGIPSPYMAPKGRLVSHRPYHEALQSGASLLHRSQMERDCDPSAPIE